MPMLELEINCLCLYARDRGEQGDEQIVHVLMPATGGSGPHAGHHKHVVRMFHPSFTEAEQKTGRSIEGWALVLGQGKSSADLSFQPEVPGKATIVDLSTLFDLVVQPALVADAPHDDVAARITLRSGTITALDAEAEFEIGGEIFLMAHRVTWQVKDVPHKLDWRRLRAPASEAEPLATLKDLGGDGSDYRLQIFHVTEESLPPGKAPDLQAPEIKEHYRMFYGLLGVKNPGPAMLPELQGPGTDGVHCVKAGGKVRRP